MKVSDIYMSCVFININMNTIGVVDKEREARRGGGGERKWQMERESFIAEMGALEMDSSSSSV